MRIAVLLGSTRRGRKSPRVARFLLERLAKTGKAEAELLDLLEYDFPVLEERLRFRDDPPPGLPEFAAKIAGADALLVVAPEYNGGPPGVLKNAIDYLYPEYRRKPVGIATVSSGSFGGILCLMQLRHMFLHIGAIPVPASFPVTKVEESFDEEGKPSDPAWERRADTFLAELLWLAEAVGDRTRRDG